MNYCWGWERRKVDLIFFYFFLCLCVIWFGLFGVVGFGFVVVVVDDDNDRGCFCCFGSFFLFWLYSFWGLFFFVLEFWFDWYFGFEIIYF